MMAGTPCPYEGKTGKAASVAWVENIDDRPDVEEYKARLKREAKKDKANKKRQTKKDKSDKKKKDKADAEERARVARADNDAKEQPRIAFLKQCVGSRHTTESVEASGNRRAKVGVKKSSTTCEKEYAKLNTDA